MEAIPSAKRETDRSEKSNIPLSDGKVLYIARVTCGANQGLYKIGISKHPERRMKEISVPNVLEHTLVHTIPVLNSRRTEAHLKRRLEEYKRGSEWFELPEDVADELCSLQGELSILEFCNILF